LIAFSLLFVAPVFQIILSVLRIFDRLTIPLGVIAFLAFLLGIVLSIVSMNSNEFKIPPDASSTGCVDCGMVAASVLIIGFFVTLISTPVIAFIGFVIYRLKHKDKIIAEKDLTEN